MTEPMATVSRRTLRHLLLGFGGSPYAIADMVALEEAHEALGDRRNKQTGVWDRVSSDTESHSGHSTLGPEERDESP